MYNEDVTGYVTLRWELYTNTCYISYDDKVLIVVLRFNTLIFYLTSDIKLSILIL